EYPATRQERRRSLPAARAIPPAWSGWPAVRGRHRRRPHRPWANTQAPLRRRQRRRTRSLGDKARRRGAGEEMALHALRPLLERHPAMLAGSIVDGIIENGGGGLLVRREPAQHIADLA